MDTSEIAAEICTACGEPTPDRDFNICNLCKEVVHFRCSQWPESGYCDTCFEKMWDGDF